VIVQAFNFIKGIFQAFEEFEFDPDFAEKLRKEFGKLGDLLAGVVETVRTFVDMVKFIFSFFGNLGKFIGNAIAKTLEYFKILKKVEKQQEEVADPAEALANQWSEVNKQIENASKNIDNMAAKFPQFIFPAGFPITNAGQTNQITSGELIKNIGLGRPSTANTVTTNVGDIHVTVTGGGANLDEARLASLISTQLDTVLNGGGTNNITRPLNTTSVKGEI
jgi:methyl-accepting chemotaxis protein